MRISDWISDVCSSELNWNDLGRFAKFGLVGLLLIVAVIGYWRLGVDRAAGKASLLVASILLGALLALFGQTYQTGADTWELFANWAVLMAPWALGRASCRERVCPYGEI